MAVHNLSLLTDLYQLTMANGYWKTGMYDKEAVFHLFFRTPPFGGNYTIACGVAQAIDYLNNLRFDVEDIRYLANLRDARQASLFGESFLNYLQRFEFKCDVDAVPEGTLVFPYTPIVRVKGPLIQAQLIESALLNIFNFATLIATKSARMVEAAQGDMVMELGLRSAQESDAALSVSRAAYIGGCHATSNVLAGKLYGIPVKETHTHSWVICFDSELEAFEEYANSMPDNCIFLLDTYDTLEGVMRAIKVGSELRGRGYEIAGIRLNSGILRVLSQTARQLLDEAGFVDAVIVASNDLDEYKIQTLKSQAVDIKVWGVGARLSTAFNQPALGGVYKLAAIRSKGEKTWKYKIKLSEQNCNIFIPGVQNTWRIIFDNEPHMDVIINEEEENISNEMITFNQQKMKFHKDNVHPLLRTIFEDGVYVYQEPSIQVIRQKTLTQIKLFKDIDVYPVGLEKKLYQLKRSLIQNLKK